MGDWGLQAAAGPSARPRRHRCRPAALCDAACLRTSALPRLNPCTHTTPAHPSDTGADLTNAVVDRMVFDKADLTGVQFVNTVITGAPGVGCLLVVPTGGACW